MSDGQFASLPTSVTAEPGDPVDTGPLYTVRVHGDRVGEVYQDRDGMWVAAYLVRDHGPLEQVEWPHPKRHMVNAVLIASTFGVPS